MNNSNTVLANTPSDVPIPLILATLESKLNRVQELEMQQQAAKAELRQIQQFGQKIAEKAESALKLQSQPEPQFPDEVAIRQDILQSPFPDKLPSYHKDMGIFSGSEAQLITLALNKCLEECKFMHRFKNGKWVRLHTDPHVFPAGFSPIIAEIYYPTGEYKTQHYMWSDGNYTTYQQNFQKLLEIEKIYYLYVLLNQKSLG